MYGLPIKKEDEVHDKLRIRKVPIQEGLREQVECCHGLQISLRTCGQEKVKESISLKTQLVADQ